MVRQKVALGREVAGVVPPGAPEVGERQEEDHQVAGKVDGDGVHINPLCLVKDGGVFVPSKSTTLQ